MLILWSRFCGVVVCGADLIRFCCVLNLWPARGCFDCARPSDYPHTVWHSVTQCDTVRRAVSATKGLSNGPTAVSIDLHTTYCWQIRFRFVASKTCAAPRTQNPDPLTPGYISEMKGLESSKRATVRSNCQIESRSWEAAGRAGTREDLERGASANPTLDRGGAKSFGELNWDWPVICFESGQAEKKQKWKWQNLL